MKTHGNISVIRPKDRDIARHILTHDLPQRSIAKKYNRNIKPVIRISGEIRKIVGEGFDVMVKRIGCGRGLDLGLILKVIELKLGPKLTEKLIVELLERHSRKIKRRRFLLDAYEVRKKSL